MDPQLELNSSSCMIMGDDETTCPLQCQHCNCIERVGMRNAGPCFEQGTTKACSLH